MSNLAQAMPTTSDVAVTPDAMAKPKLGSKLLKLNPETPELRERIRAEAFQYVQNIDRSRPLSKKELEAHGEALLEKMGLEKGYLGFAMVMLGNGFWKEQFVSIPFEKRILLLPHCLKHVEACSAHYDEFGLHCEDCGACSIGDFKMKAEKLGYKIMVAEGTPIVLKVIVSGYIDGILGIACLNVLEKAFEKVVQSGVPAYAIPLHSSNCKSTTVDNEWVMEVLETFREMPAVKTRSYLPLMRAANDMFGDEFPTLLPRLRSKPQNGAAGHSHDPVAGTEAIAYDWLTKGGKRFRPFITLAAYDALRDAQPDALRDAQPGETAGDRTVAPPDAVRRVAMAMEAFHKASLAHDDIEDNDEYRYGHQTLHRRHGVSTAINVGDYLLGLGYRMIANEAANLPCEAVTAILKRLSEAHVKLSEGQGAELLWRDEARDEIVLQPIDALKIYALKTAPAFEAALYAGLRLAGPVERYDEMIPNFSRHLGVAFQIVNDLKDWSTDLQNKRIIGQDALAMRPTLLLALALESASPAQREELISSISGEAKNERSVQQVARIYESCQVFEKARKLVEKYRQRAEAIADEVEPEKLRELLYFLIDTALADESAEPEIAAPKNLVSLNGHNN
ncbi:MAG TPA: polyprenyl synthetase family protein [Blastocatellia bacterium]|nr:polyprenyl synthetase family protein [Blastocatellia bacterium]